MRRQSAAVIRPMAMKIGSRAVAARLNRRYSSQVIKAPIINL